MLSATEIKKQLRLDADDDSEDSYLVGLGAIAWEVAETRTNRKIYVDESSFDDDVAAAVAPPNAIVATVGMKHAMLMLVGHFYSNREATTTEQVRNMPLALGALLDPYKVYC